jgi:hypothetical protein
MPTSTPKEVAPTIRDRFRSAGAQSAENSRSLFATLSFILIAHGPGSRFKSLAPTSGASTLA